MDFATEREEWLADWGDSRCVKEVFFEPGAGSPRPRSPLSEPPDVFFSDAIEVAGRCFVCRVASTVVDIHDVSPGAVSLTSWRVRLPDPVVPDVGVSCAVAPDESSVSVQLLTKALVVHQVSLVLLPGGAADLVQGGSTSCSLTGAVSAFCALKADLAAVGCFGGSLWAVRLHAEPGPPGPSPGGFELTDASFVSRMFCTASSPHTLALAVVRPSGGRSGVGQWLLSFSADGRLRLWETLQNKGQLLTSHAVLLTVQDMTASSAGACSTYIKVSPSRSAVCLVLPSVVYVLRLPAVGALPTAGLVVSEVAAPFAGAVPSLATLSDETLWSFWSCNSREHLYRFDLEASDAGVLRAGALAAGVPGGGDATQRPEIARIVTEGCAGGEAKVGKNNPVFTLYQQQDVWRAEEDSFNAAHVAELLGQRSGDGGAGLLDVVLQWWVGRAFLPGRYSHAVIAAALEEASRGSLTISTVVLSAATATRAVEEYLRRHPAVHQANVREEAASTSRAQVAAALAAAAAEFLRVCDAVWRRRHQVCGLVSSGAWAPHARHPAAGSLPAACVGCRVAQPLLLCYGGISCVRTMHTWTERWWATLHLSRDLSKHDKLEIDDVLKLSGLDEWKLCATSWFLSQCIGAARVSLSLASLPVGTASSSRLQWLSHDVPSHLTSHMSRCIGAIQSGGVAAGLETLSGALRAACCPERRSVSMRRKTLDPLTGFWSSGCGVLCLSDVLRGGIAASECAYLHSAMRDLLLLCAYTTPGDGTMPVDEGPLFGDTASWSSLSGLLDNQLPIFDSLYRSMKLALAAGAHGKDALPARGCDLWASSFRAAVEGGDCVALLAPPASFRSLQYAMRLRQRGCWEALRHWSRQNCSEDLAAYFRACGQLAAGQLDTAREEFSRADGAAALVIDSLRDPAPALAGPEPSPSRVAFREHVASLFGEAQHPQEECQLLREAAEVADAHEAAAVVVRQRLWCLVFDKAVSLELWSQATEALLRIDAFEGRLRVLAQKLRSCGRIELMLQLPEKHRAVFVRELHEQAARQPPAAGSDSSACYHLLYALHFSAGEHLQAAAVAHSLFGALGGLLRRPEASPTAVARGEQFLVDSFSLIKTDCSNSDPSSVPGRSAALPSRCAALGDFSAFARMLDYAWPVLEQQRHALLMLVSALALTHQKVLLVPPPRAGAAGAARPWEGGNCAVRVVDAKLPAGLRSWFAQAGSAADGCCVSLRDAEKLLAVVEAHMVLSGKGTTHSPPETAQAVASLGLLGLALQVAAAYSLDLWECALQPFAKLCAASGSCTDDKVAAVVDAASGAALGHMFVRSDGREPIGAAGDLRAGWWDMLEQGLHAACGHSRTPLDAGGTRLYSLVADEVLSRQGGSDKLPAFLMTALAEGPSWTSLLRVYMRHGRLEDAVDLAEQQLRHCEQQLKSGGAPAWSALQDFPVSLLVQLKRAVAGAAAGSESQKKLDEVLDQFQGLLEESEQR